uniref:RNA silencing protein n=1 Tax=Ackermannviridae sp. TaxID=2831612 RepID=A0A8S5VXS8_9CAUD|nr:MAG TPA: RNA silencing protein [Ackermannviridae sp.]
MGKILKIRLTLLNEVLGSQPSSPDIHEDYIASKAPTDDLTAEEVANIKAYKQTIDGLLFVEPCELPFELHGLKMDYCVRPLRASTPMGERVSIAKSETVPAGSTLEFELRLLDPALEKMVKECLDYGTMRGLGQWRNSGKGRFVWDLLDASGAVIVGNNEFEE